MKVLFLALVAGGLAAAPAFAETAKPADKATARTEPAKIRRAETIVDDSWTVTCAQTDEPEGKRHCSASLSIAQTDKSGGQRVVFTWVMGHQDGKLASAISVPSGIQIPPGMEIKIGDKEARKVGFSICMPDHCEALLPLEDTVVKSLSAAPTTEITVRAVNGADAKFTVNMKGFVQALADLGK
ncbi:invasion associated locus B family protein [Roseiarcus sp.]|uniref:invasion associated locus B family protein n=1 Tax=Roseiarcus sp. TaxID=1969460 RepID=UPI003F985209